MSLPLPTAYSELRNCQKTYLELQAASTVFVTKDSANLAAGLVLLPESRTLSIVVHVDSDKESALVGESLPPTNVVLDADKPINISVRPGFHAAAQLMLADVSAALTHEDFAGKFDTIRLSGFSSAGGIATLLAAYMKIDNPRTKFEVYNFGSPRFIGHDGYTVTVLPKLMKIYRVVLSEDPTAVAPLQGYVHPISVFISPTGALFARALQAATSGEYHLSSAYVDRMKTALRAAGNIDVLLEESLTVSVSLLQASILAIQSNVTILQSNVASLMT